MALIVPSIVRCTIAGTYLGSPVANIIDVLVPEGWGDYERDEACKFTAENVLHHWHTHVLPLLKGQYIAESVSYVDLSSVDGVTGTVTSSGAVVWPYPGGVGGEPYSGAIAILVTKSTGSRRGERSGRMFLTPPGEADINGNTIGAPYVTALNDALETFLEEMNDMGVGDVKTKLHVVHRTRFAEVGTSTAITSLSARARVSTQRRRNR